MPFDLDRAARAVRQRHRDALGFRQVLLDLLFAAGCPVREQAVALEFGDAVCVRTAGPSAPNDERPLVIVAIDLDGPAPQFQTQGGPSSPWPESLQSLGGPAVTAGWLAALRTLLGSRKQRPWQAILVRGPALGIHDYLGSLREGMPADAEVIQLVPGASGGASADLDLARLELVRARNIWRLPACDHAYALDAELPFGQALERLRMLLRLQVDGGRVQAVLRTSQVLQGQGDLVLREVHGEQRLLFPVNDALTALQQLSNLPLGLGEAMQAPPWIESLPDGLKVHALVPPLADDAVLPDRAGALTLSWRVEPLARAVRDDVRLAVAADEAVGPVPFGLTDATVWRLPTLQDEDGLAGLVRALQVRLGDDGRAWNS
jgi:hypothetical protein